MGSKKGRLRIEYVSPDVLRPFEGNPRTISERGLEKLQRSVEEFGFTNPILVQRGTNMIIAGHQRLKAAKAAGLTEVPVVYLDMDDTTAKAYNIADNRLAEEADWDFGPLSDLLAELKEDKFDLSLVGFDEHELDHLLNWEPPEAEMGSLADLSDIGEKDVERLTLIVHIGQAEEFRRKLKEIAKQNPDENDVAPMGWALEQVLAAYERFSSSKH